MVAEIKDHTDMIKVLVNVAGIWHGKDEVYADRNFKTFPAKVILDTITVGITAPILLSNAFVPLMTKGSGIVNISGTLESGAKGWLAYYISKRAIEDLTVGLAE